MNRIFVIPLLSLFLLLIPVIGVFITVIIIIIWAFVNYDKIVKVLQTPEINVKDTEDQIIKDIDQINAKDYKRGDIRDDELEKMR